LREIPAGEKLREMLRTFGAIPYDLAFIIKAIMNH
jgi:hypothetical protein